MGTITVYLSVDVPINTTKITGIVITFGIIHFWKSKGMNRFMYDCSYSTYLEVTHTSKSWNNNVRTEFVSVHIFTYSHRHRLVRGLQFFVVMSSPFRNQRHRSHRRIHCARRLLNRSCGHNWHRPNQNQNNLCRGVVVLVRTLPEE